MKNKIVLLIISLFFGSENLVAEVVTSIGTLEQWKAFVASVNAGDDYSSKTVTLTTSITMETSGFASQTVGTSDHPFTGTFDGGGHTLTYNNTELTKLPYCAPFRYIKNATIKNVKIAGTIKVADNNILGGIVGYVGGSSTSDVSYIDNCVSSITLTNSAASGDGRIGGIVGYQLATSGLQITNCLVEGPISSSRGQAAGVMGYKKNGASLTVSSVFLSSTIDGKVNTFVKSEDGEQTISSCYTTIASPDQGTYVTTANLESGEVAYNLQGSQATQYWGQDLNNASRTPMLTSDATYKVFNAGDKYTNWTNTINNDADWVTFSKLVANGYADMNVTMTADVTVSDGTMIGTSSKPYEGTFDGKGHTLTFTYNNESSDGIAPFQYINNATIKNLKTAGTLGSTGTNMGGVVSTASGTCVIESCECSMAIISNLASGESNSGGIVGITIADANLTVNNCIFSGSISVKNSTNRYCGIVGYLRAASTSNNITNCLNIGTISGVASGTNNANVIYRGTGTIAKSNNYYLNDWGTNDNATLITNEQLHSGEVAYNLQGNQATQYWGQSNLNKSIASTVPELTSDESKKVIKITCTNGPLYANKGGAMPSPVGVKALSLRKWNGSAWLNGPFDEDVSLQRVYNKYILNVSSAGATTLVLPGNVSSLPEGVKAYELTYTSGDKVIASVVSSITANKPVLINAPEGQYVLTTDNDESEEITYDTETAYSNGALYGVYTDTYKYVPANSYVLQNGDGAKGLGFYKVAEEKPIKITSFRAYLTAQAEPADPGSSPAPRLSIVYNNNTTGINSVREQTNNDDAIYTLNGVRVSRPTKGIYIKNGKKYIVK